MGILTLVKILVIFCHYAHASLPLFPASLANDPNVAAFTLHHSPGRIVGGEVADNKQFPYQVSIQRHTDEDKNFHFCGGSIASPSVVISAGHCARGQKPEKVQICVGTNKLGDSCEMHAVKEIILHKDYHSDKIDNDISAFILEVPVTYSDKVGPVSLPQLEADRENTACVVSGWGTTSEGGSVSHDLRYVEVPIVSDDYCKECYGKDEIKPSMVCAGEKAGGKDSCQGDSGGPLVLKETNQLVGVVSWGYGCARPGYPGVYTKISKFVPWIEDIIATRR